MPKARRKAFWTVCRKCLSENQEMLICKVVISHHAFLNGQYTARFHSESDYHTGCRKVRFFQQQSYLGLHFHICSRCGRKRTIYEPVWADLEDFQSIQISSLMWEDHMPDFVLDALNQCLPSKEREETVLYEPPLPTPNTLLVPGSVAVGKNHVHNHIGSRLPRSSGNEGNFVVRALSR